MTDAEVLDLLTAHLAETGHERGEDVDLGPYCVTCAHLTALELIGEQEAERRELPATTFWNKFGG